MLTELTETPSAPSAPSDTRDIIAALETELAGLDDAIATAARAGDDAEVTRLVTRGRVVPHQLRDRRADLLREHIAEARATSEELGGLMAPAREGTTVAGEAYAEAQRALTDAQHALHVAILEHEFAQTRRQRAAEHQRDLERQLVALLDPPPPPAPPAQRPTPLRSPVFPGNERSA